MKDLQIGQGETIRDTITVEEEGATSATFVATDGETNIIELLVPFDGLTAEMVIIDTAKPPGTYSYYYQILWDDGSTDYIPDFSQCNGECELPQLTICEIPGVS